MLTDPRQWRRLSPETGAAYFEEIRRKPEDRRIFSHLHVLPESISPLRLYAFLKAKCGSPNGFQTFLRTNSVDNLIQWDFLLEDETFVIELVGLNFRTELRLWAFVPFPVPEWVNVDATLVAVLQEEARQIAKTIATFEKWHLFVNPYQRLEKVAGELAKRLVKTTSEVTVFPSESDVSDAAYKSRINALTVKALELLTSATVLQSIAPVLGESAVNLLIYVLARDEIKRDTRVLEDTFRRNIDVRIKRLSVDCVGFARPVDAGRHELKEFLRLMNRRNDTLHGNFDPKRSVGEPLYFDQGTIPLTDQNTPLPRFHYELLTAGVSAEAALQDLKTAREFVAFLIDHLTPEIQVQVRYLIDILHLGYRPSTGRIGSILPSSLVDLRMISSNANPSWLGEGI